MSNYLFSKSVGGFFHSKIHTGAIPLDALPVSDEEYKALMQLQSDGMNIVGDENGFPVAVARPSASSAELLEMVKNDLRFIRVSMLNALTGIASRAERSGNFNLSKEADSISIKLLDITDDSALNSATTYDDMKLAGSSALKIIADSASSELSGVFIGVDFDCKEYLFKVNIAR